MPLSHRFGLIAIAILAAAGGCARYEYDVVEPSEFAGHVGTKAAVEMSRPPLRYAAKAQSDRLVLMVFNEADEPVKLLGEDSFAVDPRGESHPLPTRTIAPRTSTKLIFPPVRPTFRQSGPSVGFGVGVGVAGGSYGRAGYRYGRYGYPYHDDYPRYYRLEDDGTVYWDWSGDKTDVNLRLVFQRGEAAGAERFHHDFTFRRVKM